MTAPPRPTPHTDPLTRGSDSLRWDTVFLFTSFAIMTVLWLFWMHEATATAQRSGLDAAYVRQAKADIERIETVYAAARDYYNGKLDTPADVQAGHADIVKLYNESKSPPLQALGVQEQIEFAAQRCGNYAARVGWWDTEQKENVFSYMLELQLREYCAVQIQAAKLRLIDYGVVNGVDVYGK